MQRLRQYVRAIQYSGQKIKCKKAFFNFNLDIIDMVEAEEYVQILHGDYKAMGIKPNMHKKITRYLAVSRVACEGFKEMTGKEAELVYNPIEIDKPKKVLNLISATRLTSEKGKNRIIQLAKMFDENNIPYQWTVFTDDIKEIDNPNIIYMNPRLDIINYIANVDYLVQLSDNEGYCYSVVESLCVGTPVIVTNMPVMKEIGVNEKNGFILDFDLKNIDIEKIYNSNLKFEYKPKNDIWNSILERGRSSYMAKKLYEVEALDTYTRLNIKDSELNKIPKEGESFKVTKERLEILLGNNTYDVAFVKEKKKN